MSRSAVLAVIFALFASSGWQRSTAAEAEAREFSRPADAAETKLRETLSRGEELDLEARRELFLRVAREVLQSKTNNVLIQKDLGRALNQVAGVADGEQVVAVLRAALVKAENTLAFRPLREAPLPEGFPAPTPLGEIEIKRYPAYRLARVEMNGQPGEGRAFFTLFGHITSNRIAMTAPVEITYAAGAPQAGGKSMAFLYPSLKTGEIAAEGSVTVADVAEMTVVSIGLRGDYDSARVADAEQSLRTWLKSKGGYDVAGSLRMLGYNSPMVPAERRFAEVQLPVKPQESKQPVAQ